MTSPFVSLICLIFAAAYLLDMKALSEFQLDPQLWGRLLDMFANPDIKIIGKQTYAAFPFKN